MSLVLAVPVAYPVAFSALQADRYIPPEFVAQVDAAAWEAKALVRFDLFSDSSFLASTVDLRAFAGVSSLLFRAVRGDRG